MFDYEYIYIYVHTYIYKYIHYRYNFIISIINNKTIKSYRLLFAIFMSPMTDFEGVKIKK